MAVVVSSTPGHGTPVRAPGSCSVLEMPSNMQSAVSLTASDPVATFCKETKRHGCCGGRLLSKSRHLFAACSRVRPSPMVADHASDERTTTSAMLSLSVSDISRLGKQRIEQRLWPADPFSSKLSSEDMWPPMYSGLLSIVWALRELLSAAWVAYVLGIC